MDIEAFDHIVWCDLEILLLRIHSFGPWDTKMVRTGACPDRHKPVVNVFLCREDDAVFGVPGTYRENIMRQGSYRGHTFGVPARLKWIDERNVAVFHPDPGKIIWSYLVKYVLTIFAIRANILHLKGAAVAYGDKAFLFLGRGGSGKTEVVKALCGNGARLIANTHLLVDGGSVLGVKSNVRVRDGDREIHVPVDRNFELHHGWLPIGGVFWVKYRTDGETVVESLSAGHARANLQFFAESIQNWELKEDVADYFGSNPHAFAEAVNGMGTLLDGFCARHDVRYVNLDVLAPDGPARLISIVENDLRDSGARGHP